jgi:murein DD-endopeptidase MepM/ murein hydrolase activator NlpD
MKKLLRKILLELEQKSIPNPVYGASGYDTVSSPFGMRNHPETGERKMHNGIDISVKCGTPLKAPVDGKVIQAKYENDPCGQRIIIQHNGFQTTYCHLKRVSVSTGDRVYKGDIIGYTGGDPDDKSSGTSTTGCHLHFGLKLDSDNDYTNPTPYIDLEKSPDENVEEPALIDINDTHENISYIQCFLRVAGFGTFNTITDTFDQNTSTSLNNFQTKVGLTKNPGKLTSTTITRIGNYIRDNMTSSEKNEIKSCYSNN